jgi:hypothetical protein
MMAIQKMNVTLEPGGTYIGDFVIVKQWDATSGQKIVSYDLKLNKKV